MAFGFLKTFIQRVDTLITGRGRIDEELFEDLEEALLTADVNVHAVQTILDDLRNGVRDQRLKTADDVQTLLVTSLVQIMGQEPGCLTVSPTPPTVYLFVGVNGVGKTTTIAKVAQRLKQSRFTVMLAAADTFRAAAADQLGLWAERVGVPMIRHQDGSDPSAVVFDAVSAARSRGIDYVLADTAGRLHNRANLMEELKKIARVTERALGRPADETLLVLDATTGQNAISQARQFLDAIPVTGIVLTKMDGTARGGCVLSLRRDLGIPVKLIGLGERPDDLRDFDPRRFAESLVTGDDAGDTE